MAVLTRGMNLHLQAELPHEAESPLLLFVHGVTESGVFASLPLTAYCGDDGATASKGLTLWANTTLWESSSKFLVLSTTGDYHRQWAGLELTAWAASGIVQGITLHVAGSGINAGAFPAEKSLNLYLERNPSARFNLFAQGPGTEASGSFPLWTQGAVTVTGQLDFTLDGIGFTSRLFKLYAHGF